MFATGLWPIGLFLLVKKALRRESEAENLWLQRPARQTPAAPAQTNPMRSQLARTPQYSAKGCRTMRTVGIVLAALGVLGILNVLRSYGGLSPAGGGSRSCSIPRGSRSAASAFCSAAAPCSAAPVGSASTSPAPGSAASSPSPSSRRPPRSPSARPRRISS